MKKEKNQEFKIYGNSCKGVSIPSSGDLKIDLEKMREIKNKHRPIVLGSPGTSSKRRSFEEHEFKPEWVPRYVNVIRIITDPETGKRYFGYVDYYGQRGLESELNCLFGVSEEMTERVKRAEDRAAKVEAELDTYKALPWWKKILK